MKSRILYVCLMVIMSISTVSQAEILDDGGWQGGGIGLGSGSGCEMYSNASASADGDNTYGTGYGEGWHKEWTTVRAICYEEYYIYVWAEAHIFNYDYGYASSYAYASASASGKDVGDSHAHSASVSYEEGDDFEDAYNSGDVFGDAIWYDPDEGISSSHIAVCLDGVEEGHDTWTYSHACARAYCYLRVY